MSKAWAIVFVLSTIGTAAIGLTSNHFDYFPGKCLALGLALLNTIGSLVIFTATTRARSPAAKKTLDPFSPADSSKQP